MALRDMKCLVLCGGKGTRLKPLTYTIPKQLVPVANRPILHFVLDNVWESGLRDIGIVIAPETGAQIEKSIQDYPKEGKTDLKFTFITQEKPLGLAHAVKQAKDFLKDEPFLMYLGDNLIGGNLRGFIDEFNRSQIDALLLLKEVSEPRLFGVATLNRQGEIIHLEEKPQSPQSNLALVGVYLFTSAIHQSIEKLKPSPRGEFEITDAISQLINNKRPVRAYILNNWWLDTGKKDSLLEANRIILGSLIENKIEGEISPNSQISGRVAIGAKAKITNSSISGPVVIGQETEIINSSIGPFTAISDKCLIKDSKISSSIILTGSQIIGVAMLADSLIGRNVRISKNQKSSPCLKLLVSDDSEIEV